MPNLSIADLIRQRRSFDFDSELGSITVTYRPYQMTPAREAEIARISAEAADDDDNQDVQETEQGITKIVQQFCEVVESIGLMGPLHEGYDAANGAPIGKELVPEGMPVPVKPEIVKHFSSAFIVDILVAVGRDARPKGKRRGNSNDS